jgi:hypothetical protein
MVVIPRKVLNAQYHVARELLYPSEWYVVEASREIMLKLYSLPGEVLN